MRPSVFLKSYLIISGWKNDFQDDALDSHNRPRSFSFCENGYWIYFFDFIPMPNAGGNAGLIRKLHSFPADVLLSDYCSRYNTDLSPPLLSIILYAFIFSLIALSFRSTASFLPTPHFPVKFRRCSFKSTS